MLRRVGFFRELAGGQDIHGPSLAECRDKLDQATRQQVTSYLRGGSILATTGSMADDKLEASNTRVARIEIRTDGSWVWPGELAYYVSVYGVTLPDEFLRHMASRGWQARPLTEDELGQAEQAFFEESQ